METPELILFEGWVPKARIGEMRFGEGLYLRPAGRLSDSASASKWGGGQSENGFVWDQREKQRNGVNGKGGDILAFARGSVSRIEFQNNFFCRG